MLPHPRQQMPLPLLLLQAWQRYLNWPHASQRLSTALQNYPPQKMGPKKAPKNPQQEGPQQENLRPNNPANLVERAARKQLAAFLNGIQQYQTAPISPRPPEMPLLAEWGHTKLYDYNPAATQHARTVLVIPSLVNRAHILDLSAQHSLLRFLASRGIRPLLLDWHTPNSTEAQFTSADYLQQRLLPALAVASSTAPQGVDILGYCMGGVFALLLAQHAPQLVKKISLLATPWDFWAADPAMPNKMSAAMSWLMPQLNQGAPLSVETLQILFTLLQPLQTVEKFTHFGRGQMQNTALFTLVEDWLNDGVPLASAVAQDCLIGWYGQNQLARNQWSVAGRILKPQNITQPSLCLIAAQDNIVPPASALALAKALPQAQTIELPLGHIGLLASARAPSLCWQKLQHHINS